MKALFAWVLFIHFVLKYLCNVSETYNREHSKEEGFSIFIGYTIFTAFMMFVLYQLGIFEQMTSWTN